MDLEIDRAGQLLYFLRDLCLNLGHTRFSGESTKRPLRKVHRCLLIKIDLDPALERHLARMARHA